MKTQKKAVKKIKIKDLPAGKKAKAVKGGSGAVLGLVGRPTTGKGE
jgi:hypothetical protein